MTKTKQYDALRITDIYGGGGTFITRGYYSIPENHDQLFDIIKTLPLATKDVTFRDTLKNSTLNDLRQEPVLTVLEKNPWIYRIQGLAPGSINWFGLELVNLQKETKRVQQEAEEKLAKVKDENKQYNLLLQVTSCFSNAVKEYTYFTEQWFSDDNNDVFSQGYSSAMYAYSEEFWLDDHELENANPYLTTEKNIEKAIIDTMTMDKAHYLNFYENLRQSHASWDNSIGYQLAFHTVKSYKDKIQKDLEQELAKIQNINPQINSESTLIDQGIVSRVYTDNQISYEPVLVTSKKNKQEVTPEEYNNFKNLRQLLEHLNEIDHYMEKRVQFFLDKLEAKVHIQSDFDKEAVRRRFELYIEQDELMQSIPNIFKWYDIPRLNQYLEHHYLTTNK